MIKDHYLDVHKFIKDKNILKLFDVVEQHGGVLRFVGGWVRDALAGLASDDMNLTTDMAPDELVEACEESGIKTVPIGIKLEKVGVVFGNNVLEISSLRKNKFFGNKTEIEFSSNWEVDASKRDLTINAVYADIQGNVFDYYNGINDLEKGLIRFIGSPSARIKEDYIRILRFFRFYSIFGKGPMDEKSLQACIELHENLRSVPMEKIRDELFKILVTPKAMETISLMDKYEILSFVLPTPKNFDKLGFLVRLIEYYHLSSSALRRMFLIYDPDEKLAESLASRLKFSKKEKQLFVSLAQIHLSLDDLCDVKKLNKFIYLYGKDFCLNKLLLQASLDMKVPENLVFLLKHIETYKVPEFPIKGRDILDKGLSESSKIGEVLKMMEKTWIESDFELSGDEILQKIAK